MGILEILLIAIGLAMVLLQFQYAKDLSMKKMNWKKAIIVGIYLRIPSTYASYRLLLRNNIRKFSN